MAFDDYRHGLRHDGCALSLVSAPRQGLQPKARDFHLVKGLDQMATVSKHVDHYQSITNSILAALEQGVKPWARPWTTKGGAEMLDAGLPYNAASGRNYRGLNVPLLWA